VRFLDLEALLIVADAAVSGKALVRDHGLLSSALARPQASFGGQDAYRDVEEKAAALLHSLVTNPALVDGNKRLGWLATYAFYAINGMYLEAPTDDACDLVIAVAEGAVELPEIARQLSAWQ
jgi:death-on-curing protein